MSSCPVNLPGLSCTQGKLILAGLGVGIALVVVLPILLRNVTAKGAGSAIGSGIAEFTGGFVVDGTLAAGDVVGIPRTEIGQCEIDLAAGRWWDASFSCPAPRFLEGVFS